MRSRLHFAWIPTRMDGGKWVWLRFFTMLEDHHWDGGDHFWTTASKHLPYRQSWLQSYQAAIWDWRCEADCWCEDLTCKTCGKRRRLWRRDRVYALVVALPFALLQWCEPDDNYGSSDRPWFRAWFTLKAVVCLLLGRAGASFYSFYTESPRTGSHETIEVARLDTWNEGGEYNSVGWRSLLVTLNWDVWQYGIDNESSA